MGTGLEGAAKNWLKFTRENNKLWAPGWGGHQMGYNPRAQTINYGCRAEGAPNGLKFTRTNNKL